MTIVETGLTVKTTFIYTILFVLIHSQALHARSTLGINLQAGIDTVNNVVVHHGTPDEGFVDSYHNLNSDEGFEHRRYSPELMKTFYLMRLYKTQNLLRARKGLLELVDPRLNTYMYQRVPNEVKNVFLANDREIESVKLLIDQIENTPTRMSHLERHNQRETLFRELNVVAVTLNFIDRITRFYLQDIWENNSTFDSIVEELATEERNNLLALTVSYDRPNMPSLQAMKIRIKRSLQREYSEKFEIGAQVEQFLAQRTFLLNKYPILGVKVEDPETHNDIEVNRLIYKEISKHIELPDLNAGMDTSYIDFREDNVEFMNMEILNGNMEEALPKIMVKDNGDYTGEEVNIYINTREVYDQALIIQLDGNYDFLKELTKHRNVRNKAPYYLMALNPKNWDAIQMSFPWFDNRLVEQAKEEAIAVIEHDNRWRNRIATVLQWASVGLTVVSAILYVTGIGGIISFALASTVARIGMFTAGAAYATKVALDNLNHSQFASLAENLYVATIDSSDYNLQTDSRVMADRSYTELILVVVFSMLIFRGVINAGFGLAQKGLMRGASAIRQGAVAIAPEQIRMLENFLAMMGRSALGGLKIIASTISNGMRILNQSAHGVRNWLSRVANRTGKTPSQLKAAVEEKSLMQTLRDNPSFLPTLSRETYVEFLAAMTGEVMARKERFFTEWGDVLFNTTFAMLVTFNIAYNSLRAVNASDDVLRATANRPTHIWNTINGGNRGEILAALRNSTIDLAKPVALVTSSMILAKMTYDYISAEMNGEEITMEETMQTLEMGAWMIGLISVTSPIRSQYVVSRINPNIIDRYRRNEQIRSRAFQRSLRGGRSLDAELENLAEPALLPFSVGNNVLGVFTLATVLRMRGIQGHGSGAALGHGSDTVYIYDESNENSASFLFPVILGTNTSSGSSEPSSSQS